jgi:hypothetical protein
VAIGLPVTTVLVGETHQATAVVLDQRGDEMQVSEDPVWRTSPGNLASVSASGLVTGVAPGLVELEASVAGVSGSILVQVDEPFRLGLSLETAGSAGAPGVWECSYTARIEAIGGRDGDLATVTRVVFEATTQSGEVDRTVIPGDAISDPDVARGGSKSLSGVDRSATVDPTVTLSVLVEYVQRGQNLSLEANGAC